MKTKQKGFTLIEMLVVIGIIGLLSSLILVSVSSIRKNSLCTRRESNVENVRGAASVFYSIKSYWPCMEKDTECESLSWTNLANRLSGAGYLTDASLVDKDDDDDGTDDYTALTCGVGENCQMKLCNTCMVEGREGYNGNTRCLEVK